MMSGYPAMTWFWKRRAYCPKETVYNPQSSSLTTVQKNSKINILLYRAIYVVSCHWYSVSKQITCNIEWKINSIMQCVMAIKVLYNPYHKQFYRAYKIHRIAKTPNSMICSCFLTPITQLPLPTN